MSVRGVHVLLSLVIEYLPFSPSVSSCLWSFCWRSSCPPLGSCWPQRLVQKRSADERIMKLSTLCTSSELNHLESTSVSGSWLLTPPLFWSQSVLCHCRALSTQVNVILVKIPCHCCCCLKSTDAAVYILSKRKIKKIDIWGLIY